MTAQHRNGGRNNQGRITTRHQGGGHKQHYRLIDFKRDKDGIVGRVERVLNMIRIELLYCLDFIQRWRTGVIFLLQRDWRQEWKLFLELMLRLKLVIGLPIRNIPVGSTVHAVELKSEKGAQLARSAGASVQLIAREGLYATLRL